MRPIAAKIKRDSKSFYKYVNSKSTVRSTVGPLTDGKCFLVNDDKKMGDLLNSYFASVFTNEDTDHLPPVKQVFPGLKVNEQFYYYF